jgi:hypothetical protein
MQASEMTLQYVASLLGVGGAKVSTTNPMPSVAIPAAPTVPANSALAGTTLPAAGAYQAWSAGVAIPAGATWAGIQLTYTRGAALGQPRLVVGVSSDAGSTYQQVQSSDGTFSGLLGPASASASAYSFRVLVRVAGLPSGSLIAVACAESGVVATPGAMGANAAVTFQ